MLNIFCAFKSPLSPVPDACAYRPSSAAGLAHPVQAIPGALNDEPPPSQIPAIYKSTSSAGSEAQLTGAGRTAEAALSTVEGMWAAAAGGDSKYEPTPATSRAALNACAAGGQWERALALVRDAALDDDDGSLNDRSRVAEQVEALALGGQWLEALALVKGKGDLTNS